MISPSVIVIIATASAMFGAGYLVGSNSGKAEVAAVQQHMIRSQATQAEHASRKLLESQARSDQLTNALNAAARRAANTQEKLNAELRRATAGRTCLDQPALRLLDGAHGLRVAVPAAGRGAVAADGAVATDTDVGTWIARVGQQYDECRARLDALIEWHQPAEQAPQ